MTELSTEASAASPEDARPGHHRRAGARRWWLALVALGVALAVVTDLSVHAGGGYHQAQVRHYLSSAAGDTSACQAGLKDAVMAYDGWTRGVAGATRSVSATFTRQAIAACGFADASIVALGGDFPPRSIASPAMNRVAPQLAAWAYLDAFNFLQDLRVLITHPASNSALAHARAALRELSVRRARVEALTKKAERANGLPARPLRLLRVASLLPGGLPPGPGGHR